jgi:hypothetical protein
LVVGRYKIATLNASVYTFVAQADLGVSKVKIAAIVSF